MNLLRRLFAWLRGGEPCLNGAETSLVDVVMQSLSDGERETLQRQVREIRLVQRPQPNRMTICFYDKRLKAPLFDRLDHEVYLAQISYSESGKARKVRLVLHDGYFQSMEGRIPKTPLSAGYCEVVLWPQVRSATADALDRLEHGRDHRGEE